nr:hypothetical protein [Tanacetum cinerariifolium]
MLHSSQDDQPITNLLSTTNGDYKFGLEVLDVMISDAIKKKLGYMYYMAKKVEMNAPNKLKKDAVPRKTISLTIAKETAVDGDNDATRYGVFMHNKSTATPNSTYLSLTVTSSSLDFIQTLLDETLANELMDFMSHPVHTDAQTTLVVHNLEGNPELTSYISGASKVPLDIDQNKNYILGPSTIDVVKMLKAIIQKDELTIADIKVLTKAKWNSDEDKVSKPSTFERQMSKNTKPHFSFYNNDFYNLMCLSTEEKYTTSITKHYAARYYKQEMSTKTEGSVYSDLWNKSVVCVVVKRKWGYSFLTLIIVRRSHDKEYEFSYVDLPRLSLNDVEDIRVVIQNRVEDIQLGVERYQQTLNLTKPMVFFEGIDKKIPFTMFKTHKGAVYLNQHNVKSFMNLSNVKKFCDGTLIKICENLVDMVKRNKLSIDNRRKVDMRKPLDDSLVNTNSSGTESTEQDTSSRSGNDAHADDVDIRPIYNEEPMAEVQTNAEINVFATRQQHTEQPEINNEGEVD